MPVHSNSNIRIYQDEIEGLSHRFQVSDDKIKKSLRKHIFPALVKVLQSSKTPSIRGKDVSKFLKKTSKSYSQWGGDVHNPESNPNFCGGKDLVSQCLDSFTSSCQTGGGSPADLLSNPNFCDGHPSQCFDAGADICMSGSKKGNSKKGNGKKGNGKKGYAFHNMIRRAMRQLEQDGVVERKRLTHQAGGALTNYLIFKLAEDFH